MPENINTLKNQRAANEVSLYARNFVHEPGFMLVWGMPWKEECRLWRHTVNHPVDSEYEIITLDALNHSPDTSIVSHVPGSRYIFRPNGVVLGVCGVLLNVETREPALLEPYTGKPENYISKLAEYLFEGHGKHKIAPSYVSANI